MNETKDNKNALSATERKQRMLDYYRRTDARSVKAAIEFMELAWEMRIAADEQDTAYERYLREQGTHPDSDKSRD